MTTLYKLTDKNGYTRAYYSNACQWGDGVSHSGTGEGELCGPGWIHAYEHPLLAVVLNPIHADFRAPCLWIAEGEIAKRDGPLKVGCKTLTTLQKIPLPVISITARIRFAILCAKTVCTEPAWTAWADGWLSGEDRTEKSAQAAAALAAATAVARAAQAAQAVRATRAAAVAAAQAVRSAAAEAAAQAVQAVARAGVPIDLIALLEQAIPDEVNFEAASAAIGE